MAKNFTFTLQPLLDLRQRAEKDRQLRVGRIQQEINRLVGRVNEAQESIKRQNHQLTAEQLLGRLDLGFIANEKRYVGTLHMFIVQTLQQLALVERQMAGARSELLAAARARKVIEKLRDKQHARWRAEQARKEAAENDEIGTQLALRQAHDLVIE